MSDEEDKKKRSPWSDALDRAGKLAGELASELQSNAKTIGEMASASARELQQSQAFARARERAEGVRAQVMEAAGKTSERAQQMGLIARKLIGTLNTAATDAQDRDRFVRNVTERMKDVAPQTDGKAAALGFGYLAEAGAGVASTTGTEILFVRPAGGDPGLLKVSRIEGKSARLALGASSSAYAVSLYGEPLVLRSGGKRRGADVEILVASIGFFRVTSALADNEHRASGWLVGLGAGLNIGVPILSDVTAFELSEQILHKITLTDAEVQAMEEALAEAPDRTTRRKIARAL